MTARLPVSGPNPSRPRAWRGGAVASAALCLGLFGPLLGGCSGDEGEGEGTVPTADSTSAEAIPADLTAQSWQVRMAADPVRAPFEADSGWGLVFQRDLSGALGSFAPDAHEGRARARVHLAYAAIYRQAALMGAHATVETYEVAAQETDPDEFQHLVGVSKALLGDCQGAAASLSGHSPASDAPYADAHSAWSAWADGGCVWAPEAAAGLRAGLPDPAAGTAPPLAEVQHYAFAERTEEAREVSASDPSALLALSLWHESLAHEAAPSDVAVMEQVLTPWRLPSEPGASAELQEVDDSWLFAGFALAPADLAFVTQAREDGVAAIDVWKDRSPQAAALDDAVVDGELEPERVLDQAAAVGKQVKAAMIATAGSEQGYMLPFADLARIGTMRTAMVVAAATGQERDSGVIRLNIVDQADGPTADPVFSMATSAWDAGNRNPLRAQDAVHRLIRTFPSVAAARTPLDALHLRLSRTAAPATAAH